MQVEFFASGAIADEQITFAVMVAHYRGQWILVRHQERMTWEIPGGHREAGETPLQAAGRELFEETGARQYKLFAVGVYSVQVNDSCSYGQLYYAEVNELGPLPEMEIAEIKLVDDVLKEDLTYPLIQPLLLNEVWKFRGESR